MPISSTISIHDPRISWCDFAPGRYPGVDGCASRIRRSPTKGLLSNDNPFSEALFRTLKYVPSYPRKPFDSVDAAWAWVERFVAWYNHEHRHSGIGFVTPNARHRGFDIDVLEARREVYEAARAKNPERWSRNTRAWDAPALVALNPRDPQTSARAATELRVGAPSSTSTATTETSTSTTTPTRSRTEKSIAA